MDTLGKRLKHLRELAGKNSEEMAVLVGVSRATLSGYENDHIQPKSAIIDRYCEISGKDREWILSGNLFIGEPLPEYTPQNLDNSAPSVNVKSYLEFLMANNRLKEVVQLSVILLKIEELEKQNEELRSQLEDLQKGLAKASN